MENKEQIVAILKELSVEVPHTPENLVYLDLVLDRFMRTRLIGGSSKKLRIQIKPKE